MSTVYNKNRRDFLKKSLVAGAAGVTTAMGVTTVTGLTVPAVAAETSGKHTWDFPPALIDDKDIIKTVETDLVIVGAGCAGLFAANGAAEQNSNVIVIEKMKHFSSRGTCIAAVNTKAQRDRGLKIDAEEIVAQLVHFANNRGHQELYKLWAEKSGEVMDHYIDLAARENVITYAVEEFSLSKKYAYLYPAYPSAHMFTVKGATVSKEDELLATQDTLAAFFGVVEKSAKEQGVQFDYNTAAQQLVKGADGRIIGVIAKSRDGGYIKYVAKKGVILATGGYSENKEMVDAWCPIANEAEINLYTPRGGNTGDGFLMALWAGAGMQKWPHPMMTHSIPGVGISPMTINQCFMHVNRLGLRYENESLPNPSLVDGRFRQPGKVGWTIFDAKYEKDFTSFKNGFGGPLLQSMDKLEKSVSTKQAFKGNTIEELGKAIGVPVNTFKKTVARYNELVKKGEDEDFNKDADMMFTIEQAPFFAIPMKAHRLVTVGGLDCDPDMQVLDKNGNKIPGLYAVGNTMGNFFANEYPFLAPGLSHGRCVVLSHILGARLAKG